MATAPARRTGTRLCWATPSRQIAFALRDAVSARCFAPVAIPWPFLRVRRGHIGDRRVISRGTLLAPIARQGPAKRRRPIRQESAAVPEVPRVYTLKPRIRSFRLLTSWLHRFRAPHRIVIHTSFRRRRDTQFADAAKLIAKGNLVTKINLRIVLSQAIAGAYRH